MSASLAVVQPEGNEGALHEELKSIKARAEMIQVTDTASCEAAAGAYKDLTDASKKWSDYWEEPCANAHKTWKGLVARRDEVLNALKKAKDDISKKMKVWTEAEEAKRREAQRLAQEAARKTAEAEAVARAVELEQEGRKEEAEALLDAPPPAPTVMVQSNVPKNLGKAVQKYWKYEVTDIKVLARAVAEGKVPPDAIIGNPSHIGGAVRAFKAAFNYPGVRAWEE